METHVETTAAQSVLGQKYAFATAALMLGIASYVSLLGMEKAILAIIFAWMALRSQPAPILKDHRNWAIAGIVLGALMLVIVPTILLLNIDRIEAVIDALMKLQSGR
jgi:hypothetical protein